MVLSFSVVGVLLATLVLVWYLKGKKGRAPKGLKEVPGPKGYPFIGNVHELGSFPNEQLCKWSKEFGKIYKAQFFNKTVVVISDPKWVKDLFSQVEFSGKPFIPSMYDDIGDNNIGMFRTEGEFWEVHRRFLLRHLRDFGFGKTGMQDLILNEVNILISNIKAKKEKPISNVRETLRIAVVNSLMTILMSKRFNHDDPEVTQISRDLTDSFEDVFRKGGFLIFAPWLRYIAPNASGYSGMKKLNDDNRDRYTAIVKERRATFQEDSMRDFVDVYLAEMKKQAGNPDSPFYGVKAERHLVHVLFDLFLAGTDTTATTLSWALLYFCKFPNVLKKFQEEIKDITGNSRVVTMEDKPNMPYTLALIDEVLRHASIVPDGNAHRAIEDKEFKGYFIPKDTWVQPNLYYIHHDPALWGDPDNFRPERFLSADGKKYVKSENFMSFQAGKRQCPGEVLARDSLFLYLTNLSQQFDIQFAPGTTDPGFGTGLGFLRNPLPYSIVMKERSFN